MNFDTFASLFIALIIFCVGKQAFPHSALFTLEVQTDLSGVPLLTPVFWYMGGNNREN